MKKIYVIVMIGFAFVLGSCNRPKSADNYYYGDFKEEVVVSIFKDTIDGIVCKYDSEASKIVTSEMKLDTIFLRKVIDSFGITGGGVKFCIPELENERDGYANLIDNYILVEKDPPRNKDDYYAMEVWDKMEGKMLDLDLLKDNSFVTYDNMSLVLDLMRSAARTYKEYEDSSNSKVLAHNKKLYNKLRSTQISVFPKLRKAFADKSRQLLWEENVKVQHSNKTITYIGYMYADNKTIKESYEAVASALKKLRFNRVNFKWIEHGEYTYYSFDSPADGEVIDF